MIWVDFPRFWTNLTRQGWSHGICMKVQTHYLIVSFRLQLALFFWLALVFSYRGGVWVKYFFICQFKSFFFFALCSAKVDTGSAHRDGTPTMMSPGVSSPLSKQLDGRENSAICLKGKQRRSIAFSLQLCFHTAVEAGCLALLNDTLVPPTPRRPRVSPWLPSPVTAMIRERWDEYVRRDLILLNATSPVNSCQFCHCRFQTVSRLCVGGVGSSTRRPDLSNSCTLLNYPSLPSPTFQTWS